mmetsp:Transcript_45945/g.92717  ORF Transcript_45945/g.92717 Transcript_45945/m.92717 type:complete len:239 (+) Transcript_45945:106-822(+)|eukprot:CAMPEP_0171665058 /NCGR_PEP_ID=MMETSP0990-20121206/47214_1 /TAXON_ID=483369 /ORGANISM="non described non described, Strain CCMP2098" /LENGTH=238 /DNA_ID=CAMNT_0012248177 /DNA_START=27 /DNA_END=743 /DNA_ORIENTATION=+
MAEDPKKAEAASSSKEVGKNVGGAQRRTWDIEEYEKRARERAELGDETVEGDVDSRPLRDREEFKKADSGMMGPEGSKRAFVKHRETNLNLTSAIGKTQIIGDSGVRQKGGGWYCDVCACLLKDSANYLDHINGKKHQRTLGFSMRVERSSVNQVAGKFEVLKRKKDEEDAGLTGPTAGEAYAAKLAAAAAEEERGKKQKRDAKLAKKAESEALEMEGMDPEMMAMMGFGGFGGGAKR